MTQSIDDLVTPRTADEVLDSLLTIAASLGLPTTSWQEGAPLLTLLATWAQELANETEVSVDITRGGFGDLLPTDAWADVWAKSRFNVTRIAAQPATGYATLTNSSVTQYDKNPGEVIIAHATTGKIYRNTEFVSILALTGPALPIPIASDEIGTGSNASPGTITKMVSSFVGVGVTNVLAVLGVDKETTLEMVVRARSKLAVLSSLGVKDAYAYVAKTPEFSATSTPIKRVNVYTDYATGLITSYCATAAGAPSGPDIAIVQAAQDFWCEPWCTTNTAAAATEVTQAVSYHVWVRGSTLTDDQITTAIANALSVFFSQLAIGGEVIPPAAGKLYREALRTAIGDAVVGTTQTEVTIPAVDLAMTAGQVIVAGTLTPLITRLAA